jgi:DNA-binding transcriptional ArsR family regulator
MRRLYEPACADIALTVVLQALSDPNRLEIVRLLARGGEQRCGELGVPLAKSTLSHHLKVLREAGVIRTRVEGTQRFVSLRRADLDARFPGLLHLVMVAEGPI